MVAVIVVKVAGLQVEHLGEDTLQREEHTYCTTTVHENTGEHALIIRYGHRTEHPRSLKQRPNPDIQGTGFHTQDTFSTALQVQDATLCCIHGYSCVWDSRRKQWSSVVSGNVDVGLAHNVAQRRTEKLLKFIHIRTTTTN